MAWAKEEALLFIEMTRTVLTKTQELNVVEKKEGLIKTIFGFGTHPSPANFYSETSRFSPFL